jgi:dienelactone hydrolase
MFRHGSAANKTPIISKAIQELKEKRGVEKIGVIGYCHGGKIVVQLAATEQVQTHRKDIYV